MRGPHPPSCCLRVQPPEQCGSATPPAGGPTDYGSRPAPPRPGGHQGSGRRGAGHPVGLAAGRQALVRRCPELWAAVMLQGAGHPVLGVVGH